MLKKHYMKNIFASALFLFQLNTSFSQVDTTIQSVYDWERVKIFQEEEFDSTRHLAKLTIFQLKINASFKKETGIIKRANDLLKQITAQHGGCASRVIYDQLYTGPKAYIMQPIPSAHYSILAIIYRKKQPIQIDHVRNIVSGQKRLRVVEKQSLPTSALGTYKSDSTKYFAGISNITLSETGDIHLDANIPEEVNLKYRVTATTSTTITIIARKEYLSEDTIITYVLSK